MTKITINFKNGKKLKLICKEFTCDYTISDNLKGFKWEGLIKPKQLFYIDISSIDSIVQV